MPYYVLKFGALGLPETLAQAASYREAKALLNAARAQSEHASATQPNRTDTQSSAPPLIRMIFAANEIEAADLLTQPRAPDPSAYGADD
ncbi:MAG: hypothetical protein VW339_06340 [Quisquiliibacterium sp.]